MYKSKTRPGFATKDNPRVCQAFWYAKIPLPATQHVDGRMMTERYSDTLIPFRWPGGWSDPALLELLAGTTINCLIVDQALHGIAAAARQAGLTVHTAGEAPAGVRVVSDRVWPRIKLSPRGGRDAAQSGPTGTPWVDSNAWAAKLAAAQTPEKTIWLTFEPPRDEPPPRDAAYTLAIADAAAAGARWVVALHPEFSRELGTGTAGARDRWLGIAFALAFFEKRREWRSWAAGGPLAIVSDYSAANEHMTHEVLNLGARRNLFYRVVETARAASMDFTDVCAVLCLDAARPPDAFRGRLTSWVRSGGLLIGPREIASWFPGESPLDCPVAGYGLQSFGRGRVAASVREWDDPYQVAADAHYLTSRRNDPVRLFNGASVGAHYSVTPDRRRAVLQLVSFASHQGPAITVRVPKAYRSAALHILGHDRPLPLQVAARDRGVEYHLPAFQVYAAVEVEL